MASPFAVSYPSPQLTTSTSTGPHSPQSRDSLEAFPEFPSSPVVKSSPVSQNRDRGHSHLEIPGGQSQQQLPNRPFRSPSQRLPPTALLPSGRNASHIDVSTPTGEHNRDRDDVPQQRLPRALPAPSLSGPSIRPNSYIAPGLLRNSTMSIGRQQTQVEEQKSESLWADMQRTLADVELSAMKSSHLFNPQHSRALEKLRETQLALAQAWARTEANETDGQESEDEYLTAEPEGGMQAGNLLPRNGPNEGNTAAKGLKGRTGKDNAPKAAEKLRKGSNSSNIGRDLEEETERDIQMARKRREANDQYFSQVNRGVLDVVSRLDEVASAMRKVEKESRAVWDEMGGAGSTTASDSELGGDSDVSEKPGIKLMKQLTRATTTTDNTGTGSGTETSDSPNSPKRTRKEINKSNKEERNTSKGKGR